MIFWVTSQEVVIIQYYLNHNCFFDFKGISLFTKTYTHSFIDKVGYNKTHAHVNIYADVYALFIQKIAARELKLLRSIAETEFLNSLIERFPIREFKNLMLKLQVKHFWFREEDLSV